MKSPRVAPAFDTGTVDTGTQAVSSAMCFSTFFLTAFLSVGFTFMRSLLKVDKMAIKIPRLISTRASVNE